jgi:hypothetical protein
VKKKLNSLNPLQRRLGEGGQYHIVRCGEEKIPCLFLESNHCSSLVQPKAYLFMRVCMYDCMYICMYAYMQVHVCVLLCIRIHVLLWVVYIPISKGTVAPVQNTKARRGE